MAYPAARYRAAIRRARRRAGYGSGFGVPRPVAIAAVGAVAVAMLGAGAAKVIHHHHGSSPAVVAGAPSRAALAAVSFARHRIGCPYTWGGTGPCGAGYDCSGLMMMAYRSAGKAIPRTSETQWAGLHHVTDPHLGDLVFFAGSDGTAASPGHVGMVLGAHRMIEAYSTGYPVRISTFGLPSSPQGDRTVVGFARPVPLVPAPASYAPASWARALLHAGRYPATSCNLAALTAWQAAEGDWSHGHAIWRNPLNDTRLMPGSHPVNPVGVQAYTSWPEGLTATTATLAGPDYRGIRAALEAGHNAQAVATAVGASVWGTQPFTASC